MRRGTNLREEKGQWEVDVFEFRFRIRGCACREAVSNHDDLSDTTLRSRTYSLMVSFSVSRIEVSLS